MIDSSNEKNTDPVISQQASGSFIQSLARGLSVINSFDEQHAKQTLTQVADRTGLTRAAARRFLLTLQQLGYVDNEGRQFFLRPKVLELGFSYISSIPYWEHAQPILDELAKETGESCSISVLDDTDIVYVLRRHTHKIMAVNLSVGSRLPAYCTSMGRILLGSLSETELDSVLRRSNIKAYSKYCITDIDTIKQVIQQSASQGWSEIYQELEESYLSIAAPIKNHNQKVIAGINISGNAGIYSIESFKEKYLDILLDKAKLISSMII